MRGISRYAVLGLSVILICTVFVHFSDPDNIEYEHTGIVTGVSKSTSGYTFHLITSDGDDVRCFSYERPDDLGYYAVSGEPSEDGSIFFVSVLRCLDTEPL